MIIIAAVDNHGGMMFNKKLKDETKFYAGKLQFTGIVDEVNSSGYLPHGRHNS